MKTFRGARKQLRLILSAFFLPVAASILALGARWSTTFDLLTHFRAQYLVAFVLLAFYLIWLRTYRLACCAIGLVVLNGYWLAPLFVAKPVELHAPSDPVVVMSANVRHRGGDPEKTSELLARHKPDVVALLEVDTYWLSHLSDALNRYPYRVELPREDDFGIAVYSRLPIVSHEVLEVPPLFLPTLAAELEGGLSLFATHPIPPIGHRETLTRDAQLSRLGQRVANTEGPVLLVGDLNTTPFSPSFSDLLRRGGLRDSARGYGYAPTWPTFFVPLSIPIVHALHTPDIEILDRNVGPDMGSDHYPLIVTIRYETDQSESR
mgnify:CR=1 FL=1